MVKASYRDISSTFISSSTRISESGNAWSAEAHSTINKTSVGIKRMYTLPKVGVVFVAFSIYFSVTVDSFYNHTHNCCMVRQILTRFQFG